ncbi:MAG TPA: VOC family protein [Stackebrandtia sp.]|jgi:PhnB protein|uniref:VOC family protein n=1 Tax=Stackebrandtia sp. TaxID=2023065 RepID=UPI002D5AF67B|nr:VOC family protein [Stackebrandtia sp.]HZE37367.1 VOC family protein [Stackebrandtia sp.]
MTASLSPYIHFNGDARKAMEYYKTVLGGELTLNTFGDTGQGDAATADKIMHAQLVTPDGFNLLAADVPPGMEHITGNNITVCLGGDDGDKLRGFWEGLSADGAISVPLEKQFWGDEFGMCVDQFGIPWMVNIG